MRRNYIIETAIAENYKKARKFQTLSFVKKMHQKYQILQQCKHSLPIEALYMIRFHSLYPYHMEGEYKELMNAFDEKMLPYLQKFNQYDLYSKENSNIEIDETFYKKLIDRYFQEKIIF